MTTEMPPRISAPTTLYVHVTCNRRQTMYTFTVNKPISASVKLDRTLSFIANAGTTMCDFDTTDPRRSIIKVTIPYSHNKGVYSYRVRDIVAALAEETSTDVANVMINLDNGIAMSLPEFRDVLQKQTIRTYAQSAMSD